MSSSQKPKPLPGIVILALPVIGLIAAAVIVEAAFRFIRPSLTEKRWSDRSYAYFMPSDSVNLQDKEPQAKAPGVFRIAVVGDSFTFGPHLQLEDTLPKRLEQWLNLNVDPERKVEVLNRGFSGFSTHDEVAVVEHELRGSPDLLILQITLNDAVPRPMSKSEKQRLFDAPYLRSPILKYWSSLGFVLSRIHNNQTFRAYIDYHTQSFKDPTTYGIFDAAIKRIADLARAANVPLLAVTFPLFDFPFDKEYPMKEAHMIVDDTLKKHNVKFMDLLPAYAGIPPIRLQAIPGIDNHPNETAIRIAGEDILAVLVHEKLVPDWSVPKRIFRVRKDLRSKASDPDRVWSRVARATLGSPFKRGRVARLSKSTGEQVADGDEATSEEPIRDDQEPSSEE